MKIRNDLICKSPPTTLVIVRCILCALILSLSGPVQAKEKARVIAHQGVDQSYLTRGFLRSIFTLRVRAWPDGAPVKVFVLQDSHSLHTAFCRDILGTYPYVLRRTWDRSTFAGTGLVPTRVPTVEEMRRLVLNTPGAVGYITDAGDEESFARGQLMTQLSFNKVLP